MERLLQGLRSLLRLVAITCEALLRCVAATLAGFGVAFLIGCGTSHRMLLLVQLGGKKDPFYIRPFEAIMTPDAQTILLATKRSWRCLVPSPLPCRSRRRTIKRCT